MEANHGKSKKSVESFVYLTTGIWRGPETNKQYPTPNSRSEERRVGKEC